MRKLFYFFALSAIALGMASCGGEEEANLSNYKVKVISVDETSIQVEVSAVDKSKYFSCGLLESEVFLKDPKGSVQSIISGAALIATMTDPSFTYLDMMSQGPITRTFTGKKPGTDYAVYVCEIDEKFQIVGDVEYKIVKTKSDKDQGGEEQGGEQNPNFKVSPTIINAPAEGGNFTLYVEVTNPINWTAECEASWATVSPMYGTGEASVNVYIQANTSTTADEQYITFKADDITQKVTIKRAAGYANIVSAPTGLTAEKGYGYVRLTWNPVDKAEKYKVYYLNNNNKNVLYQTVSECVCIIDLDEDFCYTIPWEYNEEKGKYYFILTLRVSAVNAYGQEGESTEKTISYENNLP